MIYIINFIIMTINDYQERIKELEFQLLKYQSINIEEIQQMVYFIKEMSVLLNECRKQQINYKLAKDIDNLLLRLND